MTITAMSASGSPRRATRIRWPLAASCLAVAAAVIIPAGPASAAVCDGVSCNGLDPNQAGCAADAITPVPPVTDQGLTLELRYSPTCHANWARITPPGSIGTSPSTTTTATNKTKEPSGTTIPTTPTWSTET
jgi:hypothetical protein